MKGKTKDLFEARAGILKSLAHPSRLFIVDRLSKREHCVQELTDLLGADMSTVSKHLSILKHSGIVADSRRGQRVFYSLRCPCVLNFFSCVESVMVSNARAHSDLLD